MKRRRLGLTAPLAWGLTATLSLAGDGQGVRAQAAPSARLLRPSADPAYAAVFSEPILERLLRRFAGAGCDPGAIVQFLARRYRFLGYVPSITAVCEAGRPVVAIRESSHRIDLITFDPADLSRIGAAPDPDYSGKTVLHPVPSDAPRGVLRGLLLTRPGDLYNFQRYRSESEALRRLGYAIAFVPGPPSQEDYPRGAYLIQSLTPAAPRSAARRRTNYLGGTASYAPQQKGAIGLIYQKDEVLGRLDRISVAPLYNASIGGTLAYQSPLLADRADPKRLYDLEAEVFSDFRHDRLLAGVETDQRQSGAGLALGVHPLGLPAPHDLRLQIGLRHERLDLEESIPAEPEESVTSLRLGAFYEWRHTYRRPSLAARVFPTVDFALDAAGGERTFVRPGLDATLHSRHLSGLEGDLHLAGGTLDRRVPPFELWSLGGAATVRGFREDAFLGRHMAALQAELWIPFARRLAEREPEPGIDASDPAAIPLEPRAARLLKGAVFLDAGYVSGTSDGRNPAILGAGVGLRLLVPRRPLVIRIDYGWGLGGEGGDSFPYLTLAYQF